MTYFSMRLLVAPVILMMVGCGSPSLSQNSEIKTDKNLTEQSQTVVTQACDNSTIVKAFHQQKSDIQVKGCGIVEKLLPDDNQGRRHQKIIVRLINTPSKQTLLIAHNIDLAPRLDGLKAGDELSFYGEYEYNPKGGVVHWTHHDPSARHQDGWIEFLGKRYQ